MRTQPTKPTVEARLEALEAEAATNRERMAEALSALRKIESLLGLMAAQGEVETPTHEQPKRLN